MQRILLTAGLIFFSYAFAKAQDTFNLAFYNILNYPSAPPANRADLLGEILDEIEPDILMICELESGSGGQQILDFSLNRGTGRYEAATYQSNTSGGGDLQQFIYWRKNKFNLVLTDIIQTAVRDINRYRLQLITTESDTDPQFIEVFVAHLKASTGQANELLRLAMVEDFTAYLSNLDPNDTVIFAGDLNLYSSSEPAYQILLNSSNDIVLKDPIDAPGDWNSNSAFAYLHTQSTRISNNEFDGFGAGGGLDSRFDFILLSENTLQEDNPITYVQDSYKAYGNNENCYNNALNDTNCTGIYNQTTREMLYQMSDHLPVVAQLQTNQEFLSNEVIKNETKISLTQGNIVSNGTLAIQNNNYEALDYVIFDTSGRIISEATLRQGFSHLDLNTLANGLYYLTINDATQTTLKFIITS